MAVTIKTRETGQSNMQLRQLGFQLSKQGRQELPGLILQSMADETYY